MTTKSIQNTGLLSLCNKLLHAMEEDHYIKKDKTKILREQSYSKEELIEIVNVSGR